MRGGLRIRWRSIAELIIAAAAVAALVVAIYVWREFFGG